ncbi:MAG TPA: hypothetical protein VGF71_08380 [Caulobacteraceae bacterium]|jgi:hypothetical protein
MKKSTLIALILAGVAVPALALAGPFDGTWKLDTAKSKFTGDTMTYTKTATGYHFSNGGPVSYDFAVDGKDFTIIPSRSVAWSKAAGGGWDIVTKANGKVISKAHRTLSADGKTMTSTYVEYRPDGTTVHESDVYARVTGAKGLAGEWRNTKVQSASDTMKIATSAGGHFTIEEPNFKSTTAGRTDGSPSTIKGPNVPPGAVPVYKADDPGKWSYRGSLNGKVYFQGVMTVSADGKTLTDTQWVPGKKSEASVSIYDKQ